MKALPFIFFAACVTLPAAPPTPEQPLQFDRDHWLPIVLGDRCHASENAFLAERWANRGMTAPCQIFNERVDPKHPPSFTEAAVILAEGWGLPLAAAAPLLETELFYLSFSFDTSTRAQQTAWETARFEQALAASSARAVKLALIGVTCFYGEGLLPLLERVLRTSTDRTTLANEMLGCGPAVQALAVSSLLRDDPLAWVDVAPILTQKGASLALILTLLGAGEQSEPTNPLLVALRRDAIASALAEELPGLALELWKEASGPTKAALLVAPSKVTALQLALLAAQDGDQALSLELAPSPSVGDWSTTDCGQNVSSELLLRARDEKRRAVDPFELIAGSHGCLFSVGVPRLFAKAIALKQPERARRMLEGSVSPPEPLVAQAFLAEATQRIAEARDREVSAQRAELAKLPASASSSASSDPLLDLPRPSVWQEHPMPQGVAVAALEDADVLTELQGLPGDLKPIRLQREGREVWVLASSQRFDPVFEVSSGGYWLIHSIDRGQHWQAPIYTGLRALQPYLVARRSALPFITGDRVRLEVFVRQLDHQSITYPPLFTRYPREASGLFVEARLSELTQDRDGDGLTDLIEARLLTDPRSIDTDGDGLSDAEDAFPQVARSKAAPPRRSQLVSAVLSVQDGPFHVLVGDPADYATVTARGHFVVLSEASLKRYLSAQGYTAVLLVSYLLDETETRAEIDWSEGGIGGSFTATWEKGAWVLQGGGFWFSQVDHLAGGACVARNLFSAASKRLRSGPSSDSVNPWLAASFSK